MKGIRLVDIVEDTGYSIKTVSRAIHNQHDIHPETRKRIMEIVEDWSGEGGSLAMKKSRRPRTEFVSNSLMALGCCKSLIRAGNRVPDDIALVSFDNLSYIESLEPPLTTLSSSAEAIGTEAAKLLFSCIHSSDSMSVSRLTIPGTIIKQRSCGST